MAAGTAKGKRHRSETRTFKVRQPIGVAEAKAHLSEVIQRVLTEGPQEITRNGRGAVVLVSKEEWEETTKPKQSLLEFFRNSPAGETSLEIERMPGKFREVRF